MLDFLIKLNNLILKDVKYTRKCIDLIWLYCIGQQFIRLNLIKLQYVKDYNDFYY